jgi:predicted nucleic acid-binding protein
MTALDSSIIVAALLAWHESHASAARAMERALSAKGGVVIPTHALIESYSVLTRLPPPHRIAPADALTLLLENFRTARLAGFSTRSVWPLLEELASANLGGGVTYDAIILDSAANAGATSLLTLNARDFERLPARIALIAPEG